MIDEKCPTCPNYGKGYCDCGRSKIKKSKLSRSTWLLIGLIIGSAAVPTIKLIFKL